MKKFIVVLVFLCVVPAIHASGSMDGNDLMKACKSIDTENLKMQDGLCVGFILGVHAGCDLMASSLDSPGRRYYVPEGVENGQIIKVVIKYVSQHPEFLHHSAETLVVDALGESFPLPRRRSP